MARLLVELKLRMVANALRSSTAARVSFVVSTTFAVLVAIGTFWLLAQMRFLSASVDLTTVIFSIFAIGWLLCPIFAFGLDGTLDPATMALYPLRTRPLVVGLLAASAAGAWPAADVLGLLGVTIGLARGALAVIVALGVLWVRSLDRALVTTDTTTGSSRVRNAALPLARYGLTGAVAARFLRYQRRDPASLAYWAIVVVIMFVCSASTIVGPHQHPAVVVTSAVFGAAFAGSLHANPVGQTGPAFVFEASALSGRRELRAYFSGQDVVFGAIPMPLLVGVSLGLAALVRDPKEGYVAAAVGLAGLGAALAMSNIFSVVLAYPMQKRAGNPLPQQAQGFGAYAA